MYLWNLIVSSAVFLVLLVQDILCFKSEKFTTQHVVAAIFNRKITSPGPCRYLLVSRKQNHQCQRDFGLPEALKETRLLAINQCENQFKFDRWNCSVETRGKRNIFKKLYKETAFVYAITAAAMTYSIARACSQGLMMKCTCSSKYSSSRNSDGIDAHPDWFWDGCSDNLQYGIRITRIFLDLKRDAVNSVASDKIGIDLKEFLVRYNSEVGISAVSTLMKPVCKCHGVSGSCSIRTCWKRLANFNITTNILRSKYDKAIRRSSKNKALQGNLLSTNVSIKKQKNSLTLNLLYSDTSPTFCSATRGRSCINRENCSILCCGRGYNTKIFRRVEKCRCRFQDNRCCNVLCEYCHRLEDRFYCK